MKSIRTRRRIIAIVWLASVFSVVANEPPPANRPAGPEAVVPANGPASGPPASSTLNAFPLSAFAAIGSSFTKGSNLAKLGWNEAQIAAFIDGVNAAFHDKSYVFDDAARQLSIEMSRLAREIAAREKSEKSAAAERLKQFIQRGRKFYGMQQTDSGLCYRLAEAGNGLRPRPSDFVVLSLTVTVPNSTASLDQLTVDHSRIKVADLLPGLAEGVQMMTLESQAVFLLEPSLSFGDGEWPQGVERGTPLVFTVTLHDVISAETPH